MRILLGVADFGEAEEKMLLKAAQGAGISVSDCERRYTKAGIMQYLDEHPDTDVVVLSEAVEGSSPFTAEDYESLSERHEGVRVIPILMDERCGTEYIQDVFYSGIYNAVFASDADLTLVLRLMTSGRSRKEAKVYYKLNNVDDVSNDANVDRCIRHITDAQTQGELKERVLHIHQMLTKEEFGQVLAGLSVQQRDALRAVPELSGFVPEEVQAEEDIPQKGGFLSSITGRLPRGASVGENEKGALRQPDPVSDGLRFGALSVDDLFDIISNVIVGFVGNQRRAGVTHQAITAAHYLAARGYRVALADCASNGGKSMSAFEAIERYRDTESYTGGFSYLGVDYYKNMTTESLNRIFSAKESYHFVIIDYGTFSPYVKSDIGRCSIKCAVCGSMPWEVNKLRAFADDTRFLSGQMVYLIRGVARDARAAQGWLSGIVENYRFADVQEDPFDGTCYPALAELFDKYVKGLPVPNGISVDRSAARVNSVSAAAQTVEDPAVPARRFGFGKSRRREEKPYLQVPEKETGRPIMRRGRSASGTWFIAQLRHGSGSSYVSAVCANLLSERAKRVALITDAQDLGEYVAGGVTLFGWDDCIDEAFSSFDVVVMDGGDLTSMHPSRLREMARASHKFMVCKSSDEYMRSLAEYVSGQAGEGVEWSYVFNQIPPSDHGKVKRLMDSYDICFLPAGDAVSPSKEIRRSISGLLTKGF